MKRVENAGLYVHVPFCRSKCPYCDFYSTGYAPALAARWLEGIAGEAALREDRSLVFDSLYLGGGAPTILEIDQLRPLMESLRGRFVFSPDTETTIEANPEDVTKEKATFLLELGFNRLSVGAQSFNDRELLYLGRRHSAARTMRAIEDARSAGFSNLGVDLIYGFEGQSEESWLESLERALRYRPEHLSCYQLSVEKGSRFAKMLSEGKMAVIGEERERSFFLLTSRFLDERGYVHYEVSNFALGGEPDRGSRHNRKYWSHTPYVGLGPAAHSFDGKARWWNPRSTKKYCLAIEEGRAPLEDSEILSAEQLRMERLCLGFRTKEGVALEDLGISTGGASPRSVSGVGAPAPRNPSEDAGAGGKSDRSGNADKAHGLLGQLEEAGLLLVRDGRAIPTREGFVVADSFPILFV